MNRLPYVAFAIAIIDLAILGQCSDGREFSRYQVVPIEPPPGTMLINPFGINSSGVVVGNADVPFIGPRGETFSSWKAFRWDSTNGFRFLPPLSPNREFGGAFAINDAGAIAGYSYGFSGDGGAKATIWSPQQPPMNISADYFFAVGSDINNSWTIVGEVSYNGQPRAVVIAPTGVITLLSAPLGINPSGRATAVNDSNVVVGTISDRAFIWDQSPRFLGDGPVGIIASHPADINSAGDVAGTAYLVEPNPSTGISTGYQVGMVWYRGAPEPVVLRAESLVSLSPYELVGTIEWANAHVRAISDEGDVIGYVKFALTSPPNGTYSISTAYIWNRAIGSKMLDELLVADSAGWHVELAYNQNRSGMITALGQSPNGQYRTIVLIPVPEPAIGGYVLTLATSLCRFGRLQRRGICS